MEKKFVWLLCAESINLVFIGFDHVRRTSKTYESPNYTKMVSLAQKIAKDNKLEMITEYENNNF